MRTTAAFVCALAFLMSGCVSTPYQPLEAASQQKIKTIGLVSVPNPEEYQVTNFSSPGLLFGAIGGAFAGAAAQTRSSALDSMLRGAGFDYSKRMEKALTTDLEKSGYKVVLIPLPRSSDKQFAEDFSTVGSYQVDALLDTSIILGVGYFDVNFSDSALRPAVNVRTQLISWPEKQTIFSETILFGYRNPLISGTQIPAPSSYRSENFDAILNNRDRTIQGLDYGIASVAAHIAKRLGGARHAVATSSYAQQAAPAERVTTEASQHDATAVASNAAITRAPAPQPQSAQARFGKYSFVVEKMAKANGCQGGTGAYLTTDAGPIEAYRVACDAGVVYEARCEYGVCNQRK